MLVIVITCVQRDGELVYAIVMMVLKTSNMKSPDHILMDGNITIQVSACPNHFALLQTTSRAGTEEDVTEELTSASQLELETNKPGAPHQHHVSDHRRRIDLSPSNLIQRYLNILVLSQYLSAG